MNQHQPLPLPNCTANVEAPHQHARRVITLPVGCGDWGRDNATGRRFAVELIERMRAEDNPTLIGRICESVVHQGRFGGVEVGFFHELAERAIR